MGNACSSSESDDEEEASLSTTLPLRRSSRAAKPKNPYFKEEETIDDDDDEATEPVLQSSTAPNHGTVNKNPSTRSSKRSKAAVAPLAAVGPALPIQEDGAPKGSAAWQKKYSELVKFQAQFGHCKVPYTKQWTSLATWVNRQKKRRLGRYFREPQLTQEQVQKLDSIGFVWPDPDGDGGDADSTTEKASVADSVSSAAAVRKPSAARRSVKRSSQSLETTHSKKKARRTQKAASTDGEGDDDEFACKVVWVEDDKKTTEDIGFVLLPSRVNSTFADARHQIRDIISDDEIDWVFKLPSLGIISKKQEASLGSMWNLLQKQDPVENFTAKGDPQVFLTKREAMKI